LVCANIFLSAAFSCCANILPDVLTLSCYTNITWCAKHYLMRQPFSCSANFSLCSETLYYAIYVIIMCYIPLIINDM
jgi:hypothetical protein